MIRLNTALKPEIPVPYNFPASIRTVVNRYLLTMIIIVFDPPPHLLMSFVPMFLVYWSQSSSVDSLMWLVSLWPITQSSMPRPSTVSGFCFWDGTCPRLTVNSNT